MLRLVFLVAVAAGQETFPHTGNMVVLGNYGTVGTCVDDELTNSACLVATTAGNTSEAVCLEQDIADNGTKDCKWTGCQMQGKLPATDIQSTAAAITAATWATPTGMWEAPGGLGTLTLHKAFPLVTTAAANLHNGIYFATADSKQFNMGLPFQGTPTALTNTVIAGTITAPRYGFFSLTGGAGSAVQFSSWAALPSANNATSPAAEVITTWQCQGIIAGKNTLTGTGLTDALSGLAVLAGNYITLEHYANSSTCASSATATTKAAGGRTYEKVSVDHGQTIGAQSSCVQSALNTSYEFTCAIDVDGKSMINYSTYTGPICGGAAGATLAFKQLTSCVTPGSTEGWKILNPVADWDKICSVVHGGEMVKLQTQTTCAATSASSTDGPTSSTLLVNKMFPMTTVGDTNWTGQYLKSDGTMYNMGVPFGAVTIDALLDNVAVYASFARAGTASTDDVNLNYYVLMPPWQGFIPGASTSWAHPNGASAGAVVTIAAVGVVADDAVGGNGAMAGAASSGWQCSTNATTGALLSTGFAEDSTDFAVTASLKWITIQATSSCAANRTYTSGALGGRTYENVVRTAGVTPQAGCQRLSASASYQFLCTANAAGNAMDIVYTQYTDAVCTASAVDTTTANAAVTFTKATKCQGVGAAFWEIQNTDFDWTGVDTATNASSICGADPVPASASASASASTSTTATSDAAVAATAAALAAGAAALIL